jgi:hypothetical protein
VYLLVDQVFMEILLIEHAILVLPTAMYARIAQAVLYVNLIDSLNQDLVSLLVVPAFMKIQQIEYARLVYLTAYHVWIARIVAYAIRIAIPVGEYAFLLVQQETI